MNNSEDPLNVFLSPETYRPFQYPTFGASSEVYIGENQQLAEYGKIKKELTKQQTQQTHSNNDLNTPKNMRGSQSSLHNCPKQLIKHIVQVLGSPLQSIVQSSEFQNVSSEIKTNIVKLLGILQMCSKGKIKSLSKQLLKVVFEEGSQYYNTKSKFIQNPYVKKVFQSANPHSMAESKALLRQFVIKKLKQAEYNYIEVNKTMRKQINQRYFLIFMRELKSGRVSERVSKQDKEWILQEKNF